MEGKKILIIDDDRDLVKLLARMIAQAGFQVMAAFDGIQGTRAAHKESPDLIILDIRLPGGGGIGTLENLKNSLKTEFIPIIAITGYEDEEAKKQVDKHGVDGFFIKPLDFEALMSRIRLLLTES